MTETNTVADLLAAAELLRKDDWTQCALEVTPEVLFSWEVVKAASNELAGYVLGKQGARCSLGAICEVTKESMFSLRAASAVRALVTEADIYIGSLSAPDVLVAWNDMIGRTKEEVITAFEQAAANLKEKDIT